MKRTKSKIFFCLIAFFLCGCAAWTKTGGLYRNNAANYSVELPWGWMRLGGKDLTITRDGIFLENINIKRVNIKEELNYTKKKFVRDMLPEEIAEIEIDNLAGNPEINNFEVVENVPVIVSNKDGFRLVYAFRNEDGLKYRCVYYGFSHKNWVYGMEYSGAEQHYFGKNLEEFDKMIESFKILESG